MQFKLNEDIVLPLHALADFAMFVDSFNGEEDRYNQKTVVWQIGAVLEALESTEDPSGPATGWHQPGSYAARPLTCWNLSERTCFGRKNTSSI